MASQIKINQLPEVTSASSTDTIVVDDGLITSRITKANLLKEVTEKIPSQASSTNQLADKNFVNSSISTETAHYISNNGQPFTSVDSLPTTGVTNNDYAFVTGTDAGNTYYDRYKATVSGSTVTWAKEYRLNNSSFTANQWGAINSGATSDKINSIENKVDKVTGKGLSTNDYTTTEKEKLAGIASGAEVNVQADWNETDITKDSYIKNKPADLGKVDDVKVNGTSVVTNKIANITTPTKTSDLTNDSNFITNAYHDATKNDLVNLTKDSNNEILQNGTKLVTNDSFKEKINKQIGLLGLIVKSKYKESTSKWDDLAIMARHGSIEQLFEVGDQFSDIWKDTATNVEYTYPFQLNDVGSGELEDGEVIKGAWLQAHYAHPFGVQFSQCRAFLRCPDGLAAGTYTIKFAQTWSKLTELTWHFTLTQAVPAGGKVAGFRYMADSAKTSYDVYSYQANGITQIEKVSATVGEEGTLLGTLNYNTRNGNLNSMQETGYGWNRWKYSAIRQYLNSDKAKGSWWVSQDDWDIAPDQLATKDGFLKGLPQELVDVIKPIKTVTYANTVNDGGEQDITYDKVILPSLEQIYVSPQISGEGTYHRYWKQRSARTTPMSQGGTYPNIITYAVENHTSPQYVRLRSAHRYSANYTWGVHSSGLVNSNNSSNAYRFAPLVFIG